MLSRTYHSSVVGRSASIRRMRRRSLNPTKLYCRTNGCTSFLELHPGAHNLKELELQVKGASQAARSLARRKLLTLEVEATAVTGPGESLRSVLAKHRGEVMGPDWPEGKPFPILVKWLDCRERLSLQVHPPACACATTLLRW